MSFVARGPRHGFASVAPRALLVCLVAIAAGIVTVMVLDRLLLLAGAQPLTPAVEAEARASIDFWKRLQFAVLGILAVAILHFLAGCRQNLPALGVSDAVWSVPVAFFFWCLPVANIGFAAFLLGEAWRASDPGRPQSLFVNWRRSPGSPMIAWWLAAILAALALSLLPLLAAQGSGLFATPPLAPHLLALLAEALWLISLVATVAIAASLSRRQDRRAARPDVAALPAWARR